MTFKNHRFIFVVLLMLLCISKAITLLGFSFEFTGNDDLIFWQMARDYSQGIFHEPFMYGQNYNFGIEPLFAVPLLWLGIPFHYALPITTAWLGAFSFVLFACGFYRKKYFTASFVFLLIPVLMPIEYDIITTITRGFINGLFFTSFLIFPILFPTKIRSFWIFGLFSSLSIVTNPNSVLLIFPIGLYLLFSNWKSLSFYAVTLLAILPIGFVYYFSKQFYQFQPDYVVHQLPELTYAFSRIWETFQQMDRSFAYLTPIYFGGNWLILLVLFLGSLVLVRKDWKLGVSMLLGVVFILFTLGVNKVEEGVGVIFFSPTRMFLALPILLSLLVGWFLKVNKSSRLQLSFVFLSVGFVLIKFVSIDSVVEHHTSNLSYGPVAIQNIDSLTNECTVFNAVIQEKQIDLVVFTLSSKKNVPEVSFYNFGCEFLVANFPSSTMLHKERRTWLYTKHKTEVIGSILFLNYEFNKELVVKSGLQYEVIETIPDAILLKNSNYTLPQICELLELKYARDSN